MAVAYVRSANVTEFVDSVTVAVAFGANVAAGNLICGAVSWPSITATLTGVTDTLGNTYTLLDNPTEDTGNVSRAAHFYAKNIAGGANTVTATFSASLTVKKLIIHEVSGCDTTAPSDKHQANVDLNVGTGADAVTSGAAVTTTTNGQYIFGWTMSDNGNGGPEAAGTNYTIRENVSNRHSSEDRVQTTAGSAQVTFTDGANFGSHTSGILTFKAATVRSTKNARARPVGLRAGLSRQIVIPGAMFSPVPLVGQRYYLVGDRVVPWRKKAA